MAACPRRELLIYLFDHLLYLAGIDVASQFGLYASGMHSCGAHAPIAVTFVECDREEDIRRFRSAIGNERLVRCPLEVRIVQVDVRDSDDRKKIG